MTNVVRREQSVQAMINKVPEVTLAFWVIKIMPTTVGETGADYLAVNAGLGTAVTGLLMSTLLLIALVVQLRTRGYTPWIYWTTVVLVSIVGRRSQTRLLTNSKSASTPALSALPLLWP